MISPETLERLTAALETLARYARWFFWAGLGILLAVGWLVVMLIIGR